jgi:hypothetical protein
VQRAVFQVLQFVFPPDVFSAQYGPFTINSSEFHSFSLNPNNEILFFLVHPELAFVVHSRADEVIASLNTVTENETSHFGDIGAQLRRRPGYASRFCPYPLPPLLDLHLQLVLHPFRL